MSDLIDVIN